MKTRRFILYALMAVQMLGLVALYAYHASGRDSKNVIRLEAEPTDPRDLLRGDYIILRYPGLDAATRSLVGKQPLPATCYLTLKQTGECWVADSLVTDKPSAGTPFILAEADRGGLKYGIEHYYVPEGKGRPEGKLVMEVAILSSGQARIRQLYCEGKPWP